MRNSSDRSNGRSSTDNQQKKSKNRRFSRNQYVKRRKQFMKGNYRTNNKNLPPNKPTPNIPDGPGDDKAIVNLSQQSLTTGMKSLLSKGLGFCPTPPKID